MPGATWRAGDGALSVSFAPAGGGVSEFSEVISRQGGCRGGIEGGSSALLHCTSVASGRPDAGELELWPTGLPVFGESGRWCGCGLCQHLAAVQPGIGCPALYASPHSVGAALEGRL